MSSFDGEDIFGSGPHRFHLGTLGAQLAGAAELSGDPGKPGEEAVGLLDGQVIVRGRLVAETDEGLADRLDAIRAKLSHPPVVGALVDGHGATYTDMSFVSFTPTDRVDRGVRVSMGYAARFVKFGGWV